jgi:hypothetical protein
VKPHSSRSSPVSSRGSAATGTPSISAYECMTERAPPSRIASSKGGSSTSASSRGPTATGARFRAPREAEYPTKCFSVATIPADSSPRTYAVPTVATRYGSSPIVSSVRPHRASRTTSSTGARPWWIPTDRRLRPISAAIRSTSAGSNVAPHASGTG